jgi:DNA modification methylase
MSIKLIHGDCLEVMKDTPDKSIDMILCDLPYGTTACKWDTVIPFEPLWVQYKRIVKDKGAIALTASQPFASSLVMSNPEMFKYEWIWEKPNGTNFIAVNYQPFRVHEQVLIFSKAGITYTKNGNNMIYNPQKISGLPYKAKTGMAERASVHRKGSNMGGYETINTGDRHPRTVFKFNPEKGLHPTQKPVVLMEYLIKTYTNEGDTILDNCMGSGTTGVACKNINRNFIGIEKDETYFNIAKERIYDDLFVNSDKGGE